MLSRKTIELAISKLRYELIHSNYIVHTIGEAEMASYKMQKLEYAIRELESELRALDEKERKK